MDPTAEFKRLAALSGWNNERIARECGISPQYVGQIRNGVLVKGKPVQASIPVMKALILALMQMRPEVLSNAGELKEAGPPGEATVWKMRTKAAELKLTQLKSALRELLTEAEGLPREPEAEEVSSGGRAEEEGILDALEGRGTGSGELHERGREAGEPSVPASKPSRHISPEAKGRPASPKQVPK
jgi:hypothetical protein